MKTLNLSLRKDLLLVELPEGWTWERNYYDDDNSTEIETYLGDDCVGLKMLNGKWSFVCRASELTEEMAREWVESTQVFLRTGRHIGSRSALENFRLSVEAKGFYFENPYGVKVPLFEDAPENENVHDFLFRKEKWHEAQSRTFDRTRSIILIKN